VLRIQIQHTVGRRAALEAIAGETNWTLLAPEKMISEAGVKFTADDDRIISTEKEPKDGKDTYRITVKTNLNGVVGFRLEALSAEKLPGHGPGRAGDGNFILTEFSVEDANANRIILSEAAATYEEFTRRLLLETANNAAPPRWKPDSFFRRYAAD